MTHDDMVRRRLVELTRTSRGWPPPVDGPRFGGDSDDPVLSGLDDCGPASDRSAVGRPDSPEADPDGVAPVGAGPAGRSDASWRSAAFDPGRRGVKALAAVAVAVVVAAGVVAWRSRPRVEPVEPAGLTVVETAPSAAAGSPHPGAAGDGSSADDRPDELVVAVTGRVRRPGLVRLPSDARVADAVAAAGGALPGTDLAWLNLARRVEDGELIAVGVTPPPGMTVGGGAGSGAVGGTGAHGTSGKVDLNAATSQQLETLPGVGPVLAQRIIEHRERTGGFASVEDLRKVSGIGDTRFDQLRELVTV
ncbi:ComEA family DNA-binding protein [Solwaraspora sp. WMMB335]|uniref:ComEA family DNA-binding protein n=1 Tax=Solwaraspora sp. WMMB335 TaxID=3404118 RepID=UPI003B9270BA